MRKVSNIRFLVPTAIGLCEMHKKLNEIRNDFCKIPTKLNCTKKNTKNEKNYLKSVIRFGILVCAVA